MVTKAREMPFRRYSVFLGIFLGLIVFGAGFLFQSGTLYVWRKAKPETPAQLVDSWKQYGMWLPDDSEVQFLRSKLPESLVDLRRGLEDPNATVRRCTAHAIEGLGPDAKSTVSDLKRALSAEPDRLCRIYIAKAFGPVGDRSTDTVGFLQSALVNEEDEEVRSYLRYSIQLLTTGQASPSLAELVGHRTTAEKLNLFGAIFILASALFLAIIFYARRQIMKEVLAPTSPLPRAIDRVIVVGIAVSAFWYLFVSRANVFGAPLMHWLVLLLFVCFWVHAIYLLCCSTGGARNMPADMEQPQGPDHLQ